MQFVRKTTRWALHSQNVLVQSQHLIPRHHSQAILDDIDYLFSINEDSPDLLPTLHAMLRSKTKIKEVLDSQNMNVNPYVIADYGGAEGRTSLPLMYYIVGLLKEKYGHKQQFHVQINDRPSCDFRPLFAYYGAVFDSPCGMFENVSISAIGRSFYNQCFPDNSVHLGLSNYGLSWMTRVPKMKNAIWLTSRHASDQEYNEGRQQQITDWGRSLEIRGKELAPGGILYAVFPTSHTEAGVELEKMWIEMRDKGLISQEEFFHTNFPTDGATPEVIKAPFKESKDGLKSGLRLEGIYDLNYNTKYSSREQQVQMVMTHFVHFGGAFFAQGLSENRNHAEKQTIMDEFFRNASKHMLETRASINVGALVTVIRKVTSE